MVGTQVPRAAVAALIVAAASSGAFAAGFTINEHSASGIATAFAGVAAAADDASVIADNPAGIAFLAGPQLVLTGTFVDPHLPFTNSGSVLPSGAPLGGGNDDATTFAPLPNFFLAHPIDGQFTAGVGIFPSFGLATNYRPNWVGRYSAQSAELTSVDLAPTIAYRPLPNLAFGISPVARYTKVKIATAVDFGAIGAGAGIPGSVPGGADGSTKLRASGWSFAFNGGVQFVPVEGTRLGFSYYHNDGAKLTGSGRFGRSTVGNVLAAATGAFTNSDISGIVGYPDHANVGIVHQVTPDLDVRGGLTWTQWSSFKEERIVFVNPAQSDALTNENWHDNFNVAIGGTYRATPNLTLRAGLGYDETPIPNAMRRNPRLPDASRFVTAVGFGYVITPTTSIDFAYEHLFGGRVGIRATSATGDQLIGSTDLSADVFAVQLTVRY